MFYNKKYKSIVLASLIATGLVSCSTEQEFIDVAHLFEANEISASIEENSNIDTLISAINYESTDETPTFSISEQSVEGALKISGNELIVADDSVLDYETNPEITGTIVATLSDGSSKSIPFTVNVINVIEEDGAFITSWETTGYDEEIIIYTSNDYEYSYTIDWGDGTIDEDLTETASHIYSDPGTYNVSITGTFPNLNQTGADTGINANKLKSVIQWGENKWSSLNNSFRGCKDLTFTDSEAPDLTETESMNNTFYEATNFNESISHWDVSNISEFNGTFILATTFNQDLNDWDMSGATSLVNMFNNADSFNRDLNDWDTSNVTNMAGVFAWTENFNGNISNWDTSNTTSLSTTFVGALSFNQDISGWDVSNVTDMTWLFNGATSFNQDISGWDVSNVTKYVDAFNNATAFDVDNYSPVWNEE